MGWSMTLASSRPCMPSITVSGIRWVNHRLSLPSAVHAKASPSQVLTSSADPPTTTCTLRPTKPLPRTRGGRGGRGRQARFGLVP